MTTTVNPTLSLSEQLFFDLVWSPLVDAGIAALDAEVPAFAVWPLSTLTNSTIHALSSYLFSQIKLLVDVTAIQLINDAHESAYQAASLKLAIIAHDKGVDSNEFIQARNAAKIALSQFVHFNG